MFSHHIVAGKALSGIAFATVLFALSAAKAAPVDSACRLGSFALSDHRILAINGWEDNAQDLRYTLSSGEFGHLARISDDSYSLGTSPIYGAAAFLGCDAVEFHENGKASTTGHRIPLRAVDTFFDSGGTRLHGRLVLPENGEARAIVVWIQGSEDDPATTDEFWQYILPPIGIGVFVYDKRGAGASQGELSADFNVRAQDTAAAVKEARRLAPQVSRFGVFGGSQGGWVAPLTATKTDIDFVIVGYSLVEGVTAQDRYEVEEQVRDAGYGDDVMAEVHEITDATTRIVKSHWQDGWDAFAAVKKKYENEPWYGAIKSENGYTAIMLKTPIEKIREMGPKLDKHVSFNYDPRPVVASIAPRQLWVLGGADRTTPNIATLRILEDIQKNKSNLDIAIYRDADHGIEEMFSTAGAKRRRYPESLFALVANWMEKDELPQSDAALQVIRPTRP